MKIKSLFIYLYAFIGLVPYFEAIDKIYPQNLYLAFLNVFIIIYLYKSDREFFSYFKKNILKIPLFLFFLFLIWSSITAIFAVNYVESFHTLTKLFNHFLSLLILIYLFKDIKQLKGFLISLFLFFLVIESISVLFPYLFDIIYLGKPGYRAIDYRGYSGNINIMSYIMLPKIIMLLFYSMSSSKLKRILLVTLSFIAIFCILSVFKTRSAALTLFISFIIISSGYFLFIKLNYIELSYPSLIKKLFIAIIIPVSIAFLFDNLISNNYDQINSQERIATLTNLQKDSSLQQRLRYIAAAFDSFRENPVFGVGIGNWEIVSMKYENPEMTSFIVPYHAHNDYMEVLAETGIFGFILYFGFLFYTLFLLIRNIFLKNSLDKEFLLFLTICLIIHLIDSLFNFPFDRTFQQIYLMILISVIYNTIYVPNVSLNSKSSSFIIVLLLLLIPLNIYSNIRLFNSSKSQKILIKEFNRGVFDKPSLDELDKFEINYKNVTQTSMPTSTIKGLYYFNKERYFEALDFFRTGIQANPYFYLGTSYIGFTYLKQKQLDSALVYTKKAFDNAPNNFLFYGHYLLTLEQLKDSLAVKNAYNKVKYREPKHENLYLGVMNNILSDNKLFALEDVDLKLESGNDQLKKNYYAISIGYQEMINADIYYERGEEFFENDQFELAAEQFANAAKINPYELPYKENAANAYMKLGKDSLALEYLDELIEIDGTKSAKTYYLRGLVKYGLSQKTSACQDLLIAHQTGLIRGLYITLCQNYGKTINESD